MNTNNNILDLLRDVFYFPQVTFDPTIKEKLNNAFIQLFRILGNDQNRILKFIQAELNKEHKEEIKRILFNTRLTTTDKESLGTELSIDEQYKLMLPNLRELPEGQEPGHYYNEWNSDDVIHDSLDEALIADRLDDINQRLKEGFPDRFSIREDSVPVVDCKDMEPEDFDKLLKIINPEGLNKHQDIIEENIKKVLEFSSIFSEKK